MGPELNDEDDDFEPTSSWWLPFGWPLLMLCWMTLGLIGWVGDNAIYQAGKRDYRDNACWSEDYAWRHIKDELQHLPLDLMAGPISFVMNGVFTGLYSHGFSFHVGVPKRCLPPAPEPEMTMTRPGPHMTLSTSAITFNPKGCFCGDGKPTVECQPDDGYYRACCHVPDDGFKCQARKLTRHRPRLECDPSGNCTVSSPKP